MASQAGAYLEKVVLSWRERERDWRLGVRVEICITHLANTTRKPIGLALAATWH